SNPRVFINNNVFLIASAMTGLAWRFYNYNLLIRKLSLEYDLSQDKEQLARYSTQLEQLVEERTRELNKSELMLRSLFDNANDGIVIMDRNGIILDVNQKACEIHGFDRDALIGTNIELLEPEENKQLFRDRRARILSGGSLLFETQHYRRDGSRVSLEISSKAIEVEGNLLIQSFHRDVTDRKRLQEQLFQSQKMESIGVLAGGIAHDFNNILSAILGHAELLHEFSNLDSDGKQKVTIIENSARKAGQMISKLLSFARQGSFESVPLNLNEVIKDTVELIERMMMKRKIDIKIDLDGNILPINGDSNQLEQVIMNLVVNGADAMPDGGLVTISTGMETFEKDAIPVHPLLAPGKYVSLKISDTGTGIPDEIKDRIFDPFFTTKKAGKGTGLGLAMVYGIVKEHKGVINLKTQLGKGTTFEIYLPVSDKDVSITGKPLLYSMAGREKILVIDDENDILSFMKEVLESQGYRVIVTDNPIYALDMFRQISDDIDLVITDIVMPLVNGRDLIKSFKTIKPSVRMIAISGYEIWNIGKKDKDVDAYIRKPFEGIYLLSVVRRVLDSKGLSALSR
ncbi:MAG TPA: PAS domain S-box protein, partial [Thermodesulfovibrionales bacterium]|nr:PAS domain S-box protein [Thermodesulfovibrionales bacterium]